MTQEVSKFDWQQPERKWSIELNLTARNWKPRWAPQPVHTIVQSNKESNQRHNERIIRGKCNLPPKEKDKIALPPIRLRKDLPRGSH